MKILYVDTTTPDLVVAIIEENSVKNFSLENLGVKHSETLCNCIADAMEKSNLAWSDLDAYACAVGPGSFTGIRIGISTLKGYNMAVPKPLISVNCLQAVACSQQCGNLGRAVIDAGNGYYFADYNNGVSPCLISYQDERAENAGKASGGLSYLDGAVQLVKDSFAAKNFCNELEPMYIRRSQAEEQRG